MLSTTQIDKVRNHMIISFDAEKVFDKRQHHFSKKVTERLEMEGAHLAVIRAKYDKPIANTTLNEFSPRSET